MNIRTSNTPKTRVRPIRIAIARFAAATRARYLRHLMQSGEALSGTLNSIHNLAYYLGIMRRVRADLGASAARATGAH